jgi:hypothetical protein
MEFIEHIVEVEESLPDKKDEGTPIAPPLTDKVELEKMHKELEESMKQVEDKKDIEEKQEDAMKELMEKSNCAHPESKRVFYRQDTSKGSRYFPVCSFCGKRERYVKADSLDDKVKETALLWED